MPKFCIDCRDRELTQEELDQMVAEDLQRQEYQGGTSAAAGGGPVVSKGKCTVT